MKAERIRTQRIGDMIRHELASLIIHDVKDPRVHGLITVTRVEMAPDLKTARAFVSILENVEEKERVLKGLKNASGYLQSRIAKNLKLRHTPHIQFKIDDSILSHHYRRTQGNGRNEEERSSKRKEGAASICHV